MNVKKSQSAFVGVTLTTLMGVSIVLLVYAATLFTLQGGEVTVGTVGGNLAYSLTNVDPGTWTSTLSASGTGISWFAKLTTNAGGYAGPATITWQLLQKDTSGNYNPIGIVTTSNII